MKSIYLCLLFIVLGCQNQGSQQNVVKENLVRNFLQSELAIEMKGQLDKLYILNNEYCEKIDCQSYFKDYEDEIKIISKEDAFMRGFYKTLTITEIDEQNGRIKAKKVRSIIRRR